MHPQTQRPGTVDVLIVTAIKLEFDAVLAVETGAAPGSRWEEIREPNGVKLAVRGFVAPDGTSLSVVVARPPEMEAVWAAAAAGPLVTELRPRCVAMSGVCAGRRGEVALGDVIFADRVWKYDAGKYSTVTEGGVTRRRFRADIITHNLRPDWRALAADFQPDEAQHPWIRSRPVAYRDQLDWLLERCRRGENPHEHPDVARRCPDLPAVLDIAWGITGKVRWLKDATLEFTPEGETRANRNYLKHHGDPPWPPPRFRCHVGPIGTGSAVRGDAGVWDELEEHERKVLGLEMEAQAIGVLAELHGVDRFVVAKGVMDHADGDKDDHFKDFAARASAECLVQFVRENLPPVRPASANDGGSTPAPPGDLVEAAADRRLVVWLGGESAGADAIVASALSAVRSGRGERAGSDTSVDSWTYEERLAALVSELADVDVRQHLARLASEWQQPRPLVAASHSLEGAIILRADWHDLSPSDEQKKWRKVEAAAGTTQALRSGDSARIFGGTYDPGNLVLELRDRQARVDAIVRMLRAAPLSTPVVLVVGVPPGDADAALAVHLAKEMAAAAVYWLVEDSPRARAFARIVAPIQVIRFASTAAESRFLSDLVERVRLARQTHLLTVRAQTYEGEVLAGYEKAHTRATVAFDAGAYDEALEVWQSCLASAEKTSQVAEGEQLRIWELRLRLNIAACRINLQQVEEAAADVARVSDGDVAILSAKSRAHLALLLVELGQADRASAVLPLFAPDEEPVVVEARTRIGWACGRELPVDAQASATLAVAAASSWLGRGNLEAAARHALHAVDADGGPSNGSLVLGAVAVLIESLGLTVHEAAGVSAPIPVALRPDVVGAIESALAAVGSREMPAAVRRPWVDMSLEFAALADDGWLYDQRARELPPDGPRRRRAGNYQRLEEAEALARRGRLEEALAGLPEMSNEWAREVAVVQLLRVAGRPDEALDRAIAAAARWAGRGPVAAVAARLLLESGAAAAAVGHARAAFEALPGTGNRVLLARCLLAAGDQQASWDLLERLVARDDPPVLRLAARAAAGDASSREIELLDRYLALRTDDLDARVERAGALYRLGRVEEAAVAAAALLSSPDLGSLALPGVLACAEILRVGAPDSGDSRPALLAVERVLRERFPRNAQAEAYRATLLVALGGGAMSAPIDYALLQEAGVATAVDVTEVPRILAARQQLLASYERAWRSGDLSFEAVCDLTGLSPARLALRVVASADAGKPTLSALPTERNRDEQGALLRSAILLGPLELCLLQALGVLETLGGRLSAAGGRIMLFTDVWDGVLEGAAVEERMIQRSRLERLRQLLDTLHLAPGIVLGDPSVEDDDEKWSSAQGLQLIGGESAEAQQLHGHLLATLANHGLAPPETVDALWRSLPAGVREHSTAWSTPPARAALGGWLVEELHEHGLLPVLGRVFRGGIAIGPASRRLLDGGYRDLRERADAAELTRAIVQVVGRGIAAGWADTRFPRPLDPGLFAGGGTPVEGPRVSLRKALVSMLSYRRALVSAKEVILVSADFAVAAGWHERWRLLVELGPFDPTTTRSVARDYATTEDRVRPFADLVDCVLNEQSRAGLRNRLVELGLADAIDADDIRALARTVGDLDKIMPRALLDALEHVGRNPDHLACAQSRRWISTSYAAAIWREYLVASEAEQTARLAEQLLSRVADLDKQAPMGSLDWMFHALAWFTVREPSASIERTEGEVAIVSGRTPAGRLWHQLAEFAGGAVDRRAAFSRGVRDLFLALAEQRQEVSEADEVLLGGVLTHAPPLKLLDSDQAGAAILSALWHARPLARLQATLRAGDGVEFAISPEEILAQAAEDLSSGGLPAKTDGFVLKHLLRPQIAGNGWLRVPAEAVLLRASPSTLSDTAPLLAALQSSSDGRARDLLMALAEAPEDEERRRAFALHAAASEPRTVREDPAVILAWRGALHGLPAGPSDLDELRALLSEPGPLAAGVNLLEVIRGRIETGGWWSSVPGAESLLRQATELPGLCAAQFGAFGSLYAPTSTWSEIVLGAVEDLKNPCELSVGRVCSALFTVATGGDGEQLSSAMKAVLDAATKEPSQGAFALAEPSVLRLCGRIVQELARPGHISSRDGIWLTWRLYQWWSAQYENADGGARKQALEKLCRAAPAAMGFAALPAERHTLFDPFAADAARFPLRLAASLFCLAQLPGVLRTISAEAPVQFGRAADSVLDRLASLASLELTDEDRVFRSPSPLQEEFGWPGSAAIPDLALSALLAFRTEAFFLVPEERRLGWWRDLPVSPNDAGRVDASLTSQILNAAVLHAARLTASEREQLETYLELVTADVSPMVQNWRELGAGALFAAGEAHLESRACDAVNARIDAGDSLAGPLFATLVLGLVNGSPERWRDRTRHVVTEAHARGADVFDLLHTIRMLIDHGLGAETEAARELLREMIDQMGPDERMNALRDGAATTEAPRGAATPFPMT